MTRMSGARGCSSPSKGSIRAASRRRRRRCATHLDDARTRVPAAVVPRLRDADRRGDRARRCTASATTGPTSCSCSTSPTATRSEPEIERALAAGVTIVCDRYLASSIAYGEAQGLDAGVARRDPALPAAARPDASCSTSRRRPRRGGRRRAATGTSATSRCSRACATSYRRQAAESDGWLRLDGERPREAVSRPTSSRRSRHDSRRGKRAHLARAAARSTRAHASSVAPVVVTSSTSSTVRPVDVVRAAARERVADVARAAAAAGRSVCDGVARVRAQRVAPRQAEMPRQLLGLVEAARAPPPPVQRHRHDEVDARQQRRPALAAISRASGRASERPPAVLQRVQDRAQRAVVRADRPRRATRPTPRRRQRGQRLAPTLMTRQLASGSPHGGRTGGVSGTIAAQQRGADGAAGRLLERGAAGGARRARAGRR